MRCGVEKCRHRFVKKRAPERYKHWPKCPKCDSPNTRSVEAERQREMDKQDTCNCPSFPFPHRAGSFKACVVSVDAGVAMNDEDYEDYLAVLATPRGGGK